MKFSKILKYEKEIEILFVFLSIFLVFYWTYLIFDYNLVKIENQKIEKLQKYYKIAQLVEEVKTKEKYNTKNIILRGSLLSNFQRIAKILNLENKILSIKPDSLINQENIKIRLESLYYKDVLLLLKNLERYSNIEIKNLLIRKRFDNPQLVDMTLMIVKTS